MVVIYTRFITRTKQLVSIGKYVCNYFLQPTGPWKLGNSLWNWSQLNAIEPQWLKKSTLVQVMAWCRQVTNHYPSQFWPRFTLPHGVTRPRWINVWSKDLSAHVLASRNIMMSNSHNIGTCTILSVLTNDGKYKLFMFPDINSTRQGFKQLLCTGRTLKPCSCQQLQWAH